MQIAVMLFNFCIGLVFGIASLAALSPAIATFSSSAWIGWVIFGGVSIICAYAPTIRRGFGRGCLSLGASLFILPLSFSMLSTASFAKVMSESHSHDLAATAIGAAAAGGLVTIFAGFFGVILGFVFLIIGLVLSLGGQRDVRVVNEVKIKRVPKVTRKSPKAAAKSPWR